jgi:hypothetical protein
MHVRSCAASVRCWLRQINSGKASLAKAFRGELMLTEAALAHQEGRDFESAEQLLERLRVTEPGTTHSSE